MTPLSRSLFTQPLPFYAKRLEAKDGTNNEPLPFWNGVIELKENNFELLFRRLLNVEGLMLVSVTLEESLDLEEDQLTVRGFPWGQPNLIIAAINERSAETGEWVIEKGHSYQLLTNELLTSSDSAR